MFQSLQSLPLALAVALLSGCAARPPAIAPRVPPEVEPDPAALFSGCVRSGSADQGILECPGVLKMPFAELPASEPGETLERITATLKQDLADQRIEEERETRGIAGKSVLWHSIRIYAGPQDPAPALVIQSIAMAREGGGARSAACTPLSREAAALERCSSQLRYFVGHRFPDLPPPRRPDPVAAIGARSIEVPEGCAPVTSTGDVGRIDCPDGSLSWWRYPTPSMARNQLEFLRNTLAGGATPLSGRESLQCEIAGFDTRCWRLSAPAGEGRPTVALMGVRDDIESPLTVLCFYQPEAVTADLPSVCTQLVELP